MAEPYVVFTKPRDLLGALYYFSQETGDRPFPTHILETRDGCWALAMEVFGDGRHFNLLAKQYGLQVKISTAPPVGKLVPIWRILGNAWSHHDAYQSDLHHDGSGVELPKEGWDITEYDPHNRNTQYLLGARDEQQAEAILRTLTDELVQGIRAFPLLLESVGEQSPFCFFWVVTMERPSLNILHTAGRAWWGPVGYGQVRIFQEWPHYLNIPEVCLHKLPWGAEARFVLLSQSEPEILIARRSDHQPTFSELIHIADFEAQEYRVLETHALPAERSPLQFKVRIKLVDEDPRRAFANRLSELSSEIRAKEALRNWMQERVDTYQELDLLFEPLFLYYDLGDGLPFELRRLLLEWSDQDHALRSLCYQKLTAHSLPQAVFPGLDVHVLTTPYALGRGDPSDLGVRLQEYRPQQGRFVSFDLMPDWAQFGLRLFVPHEQRPALYPALPLSAVATEKLAQALLPGKEMQDWAVLLVPATNGYIRALQLEISHFKPLIESFEWDCTFDVEVDTLKAAGRTASQVCEQFLQSIEDALALSVKEEAVTRLRNQEDIFLTELERLGQELTMRGKRVTEQQAKIAEHRSMVDSLNAMTGRLATRSNELIKNMDTMLQSVNWTEGKLKEIAKEIASEIQRWREK